MTSQRSTQPLRDEHAELMPHVERLRDLGDAAFERRPDMEAIQRECLDFLQHHLLIHAGAEERVLYPAVAMVLNADKATATMSRDHVEVERLTQGLADVLDPLHIARVAYGLYAVVSLHFAKEEEVYLPLLDDALTTEDATRMFTQMEAAAADLRKSE
jgi:hemerythrin-like domain-containing protein